MNATIKSRGHFIRGNLPNPVQYYESQGFRLIGHGEWRSAVCPFHDDKHPSLRVNVLKGAYRCMACGAHGGDTLAFHMHLHGKGFIQSAKELGAWRVN